MPPSHDGEDVLDYLYLVDPDLNFFSSSLWGAAPADPEHLSLNPFASNHPDSTRTLIRYTQRLVLDVSIRKQGSSAYVSGSSDAEEGISGSFGRAVQVNDRGRGANVVKAASKAKATAPAGRDEHRAASEGDTRRRAKLKKPSVISTDQQESDDSFVRSDGDSISE